MRTSSLVSLFRAEYSGPAAKETVAQLSRFHCMQASRGYRQAAEWCRTELDRAGVQAEVLSFPAEEKTRRWCSGAIAAPCRCALTCTSSVWRIERRSGDCSASTRSPPARAHPGRDLVRREADAIGGRRSGGAGVWPAERGSADRHL